MDKDTLYRRNKDQLHTHTHTNTHTHTHTHKQAKLAEQTHYTICRTLLELELFSVCKQSVHTHVKTTPISHRSSVV